jgi:hypothetical protein
MAMVELARISAKEGFSGAIEVRRSCVASAAMRAHSAKKSEEPFGAFVRQFARRSCGDSSATGRAEPQRIGALLL